MAKDARLDRIHYLLAVSCLVISMTCRSILGSDARASEPPFKLKPTDTKYPSLVPNPRHVVSLIVPGNDLQDVHFIATYTTDKNRCAYHMIAVGEFEYFLTIPLAMEKMGDGYRGAIVIDRFQEGRCGWHLLMVDYQVGADETANGIAIHGNEGLPILEATPQMDLWCYRAAHEGQSVHACEDITTLKWSNAFRVMSREFLTQFSPAQLGGLHRPPIITSQTESVRVYLHDLNEIAGALVPVGDEQAQLKRAAAERAAAAETAQAKAADCAENAKVKYLQTHRPVTGAMQAAAFKEIDNKCRVDFGLQPESDLFDHPNQPGSTVSP